MSNKSGARFHILTNFFLGMQQIWAIAEADIRKLRHDPYELFTRMIQPAIWLLIFGQAMAKAKAISTGNVPYLDYIAPGILAQSILFIAIFYGIALIWERDMGILHKILVSPAPRVCLVAGRGLAAGIRALSQVLFVYLISYLLGVNLRFAPPALIGLFFMVMLGAALFSTLSLIVASIVKKRERFMGIGQVMTMPLFFASNALYPLDNMPDWIHTLSKFNPLTYQVDALRHLMITGEPTHFGLVTDYGIVLIVLILFIAMATRIYPKILY